MRTRLFTVLFSLVFAACSNGESTNNDPNPGINPGSGGSTDAGSDGSAASPGTGGTSVATGGSGGTGSAGTGGAAGGSAGTGAAGTAGGGGASGGSAGASGTSGSSGAAGGSGTGGSNPGGPGDPCETDADCDSGLSCQVVVSASQDALELQCAAVVGANGNGVACASHSDCRSGRCIGGYCSTPCTGLADCLQAASCREETITIGALSGSFDLCVTAPCESSEDCDPGEACSDIRTLAGEYVAYCRDALDGAGPVGQACEATADCASMLCPSWIGFCTEVCTSDADCAAAEPQACVDVWVSQTSVLPSCAPLCTKLSDCPSGSQCFFVTDTLDDETRSVCGDGYGSDPVGADCSTTINCGSGMCLTNYDSNGQLVDSICTAPCETGADCPPGYQVCATVNLPTPSGAGTQAVGMCNHP